MIIEVLAIIGGISILSAIVLTIIAVVASEGEDEASRLTPDDYDYIVKRNIELEIELSRLRNEALLNK